MNSSAVGIITRKLSNLEKRAQRRIEADERQIDPIDYTAVLALRDTIGSFNNVLLASSEASSEDDISDVDVGQLWRSGNVIVDLDNRKKEEIARRKERTADWLLQAIDPALSVKK